MASQVCGWDWKRSGETSASWRKWGSVKFEGLWAGWRKGFRELWKSGRASRSYSLFFFPPHPSPMFHHASFPRIIAYLISTLDLEVAPLSPLSQHPVPLSLTPPPSTPTRLTASLQPGPPPSAAPSGMEEGKGERLGCQVMKSDPGEQEFLSPWSLKIKPWQWCLLMLGRSGSTAVAAAPLFGHCFSSNLQRRELSEQGVGMGVGKEQPASRWM